MIRFFSNLFGWTASLKGDDLPTTAFITEKDRNAVPDTALLSDKGGKIAIEYWNLMTS
ncbi:MAG TPA: hypothetical protein VL093_00975 [Flavipsychrobacter sp.]|nr:hypothetical protein [Flavipsychrobacter sp.]